MDGPRTFQYAYYSERSLVEKTFGSYKSLWVVVGIAILYLAHNAFLHFDIFPLHPVFEYFWNALVLVTPMRVIIGLEKWRSVETYATAEPEPRSRSELHAFKSEALRRVFGLGSGATEAIPGATRTRKASWLGGLGASCSDAPPGLGNWDNSCYQNSVLQGLSALRSLSAYLQDSDLITRQDSSTTAGSLRETMSSLNDAANNGRRIWTPAKLKSMSSWQQQDAQEYYSRIMDDLEKETAKSAAAKTPSEGLKEIREWESTDTIANEDRASAARQQVPLQKTPLDGTLAQRVACLQCGFSEGLSMIPFNCLTVPLGSNHGYDLAQCLDAYTNLEEISGVECAKCTLLQQKSQLENMTKQKADVPAGPEDATLSDAPASAASLPPELMQLIMARLMAVQQALDDSDFSDATLNKKCQIPKKARVSGTKTRQAVIARAPTGLVVHVNRSLFDEYTGAMRKNTAQVDYPKILDLGPWILGTRSTQEALQEEWRMNPAKSMIAGGGYSRSSEGFQYILRAAVCHYGRHENGHYICYREHAEVQDQDTEGGGKMKWWRLSDDDVTAVSEEQVMGQGGVFMLFYERIGTPLIPETNTPEGSTRADTSSSAGVDARTAPLVTTPVVPEEAAARDGLHEQTAELATAAPTQTSGQPEVGPIESATVTDDLPVSQPLHAEPFYEAQQAINELRKIPTPPTLRTARRGSKKSKGSFESPFRAVAAI